MKIIITKEDLDQVERAIDTGCGGDHWGSPIYDQFTMDLWDKIRLCVELGLELKYEEEYTESEESMAVGMINGVRVERS